RNPRLIVNAYSNLGYSLLRFGEMKRAQEVLFDSLHQAQECEALLIEASTLESLGELFYLQGDFASANQYLNRSLTILQEIRAGFNHAMALLTAGRGSLLARNVGEALSVFRESLEICDRMGDPRGRAAAQLCLIEAHLAAGELAEAQSLLKDITPEIERLDTTFLIGHLREVSGAVALSFKKTDDAVRAFNQAITIREVMGDRYRLALAHFYLGQAHAQRGETDAAGKAYATAQSLWQELNAQPMLERLDEAQQELEARALPSILQLSAGEQVISLVIRLLEAEFAREVLFHELIRILHDELAIAPVIIFHEGNEGVLTPLAFRGCDEAQANAVGKEILQRQINPLEAGVYRLVERNETIWLYLGKRQAPLPDSLLELLIKQFRLGLERSRHPEIIAPYPASATPHELHPVSLPGLVYRSEAMRKVVEQVLSLRSSDITVLITGETGTGKELVARAIHAFSKRASFPFIPFNCAAAPRELIESQLFGHRRGAFTGATADFPGMIGAAEKGTLFLDEIGELARELQPKLLRFLQNGEVQRIGETMPRTADVRVLAATNRDLEEMVAAGDFRPDLFYRLNVIQFHLPALRERREEIPLLADHFLARYMAQEDKKGIKLAPQTLTLLKQYDWPGNARQLENEIQRLVALTTNGTKITEDLLSPHIRNQGRIRLITPHLTNPTQTLSEAVAETERQLISSSLTRHKGNISKVASELGVSRFGLRKMIRRHQIIPQRKVN
ncbi:MAG TPA: sigma 54-interacting transcriptional regulator, partial [Blastocatellia bacterium]|nr:sigma 54-interacting transcriptional regulator [Blastocatellia bacterium]